MARHPRPPRREFGVERPAKDGSSDTCPRCEAAGRTCPVCVQRRRRAWRLVDGAGRSVSEAAELMGLSAVRVSALVAEERDRLDLAQYRINSIPTARARAFLEQEMRRDPTLTRAEVAYRLNMSQADFDRQFGYAPAKKGSGATQQRVGIPLASNLTLALGRAPHELEGC